MSRIEFEFSNQITLSLFIYNTPTTGIYEQPFGRKYSIDKLFFDFCILCFMCEYNYANEFIVYIKHTYIYINLLEYIDISSSVWACVKHVLGIVFPFNLHNFNNCFIIKQSKLEWFMIFIMIINIYYVLVVLNQ